MITNGNEQVRGSTLWLGGDRVRTVEFWLVILGAAIGAAASFAGSIIIGRRGVVRSNRMRLLDETVPELLGLTNQGHWKNGDLTLAVAKDEPGHWLKVLHGAKRLAAISGRKEVDRIEKLEAIATDRRVLTLEHGHAFPANDLRSPLVRLSGDADAIEADDALILQFYIETLELEKFLIDRIL